MRNVRELTLLIIALSATACSLKPEDTASTFVSISFPKSSSRATHLNASLLSLGGGAFPVLNKAMSSAMTVPNAIDEFTCFGVNVTGPGIPRDPSIDDCVENGTSYPGIFGGLVPVSGGAINLQVPAGPGRKFTLFALKSSVGCPTTQSIIDGEVNTNNAIEDPFIVGTTTVDINGDAALDISASWNPAQPKRMFCGNGSTSHVLPFAHVGGYEQIFYNSGIPGGYCETYELSIRNPNGTQFIPPGGVTLTVDVNVTNTALGTFYSSPNCVGPIAPGSLPLVHNLTNGAPEAYIYFKPDLSTGSGSITATVPVVTAGTYTGSFEKEDRFFTIYNNPPNAAYAKIRDANWYAVSASNIAYNGSCFGPFNLMFESSAGMTVPVHVGATLNANMTGSLELYTNNTCIGSQTTIAFTQGQRGAMFYVKATDYGAQTLNFSSAGPVINAANTLNLVAGPTPTSMVVTTATGAAAPTSLAAGTCHGPFEVRMKNGSQWAPHIGAADRTIAIDDSSTGTIHTAAGCASPASPFNIQVLSGSAITSGYQFWVKKATPGTAPITVTDTWGTPLTGITFNPTYF